VTIARLGYCNGGLAEALSQSLRRLADAGNLTVERVSALKEDLPA
jgi:hypothetical protein